MKKIYKLLLILLGFIVFITVVYATVTIAKDNKTAKIPWQGTASGYYDSAHNVGDNYQAQSRFSFLDGTSIVGTGGIVKDSVTGLIWQSDGLSASGKNWTNAKIYCDNLTLGGYSDWRLPDIIELQSIVDYSKNNPAINTNYFNISTSLANYYWSSTVDPSSSSADAFNLEFNVGTLSNTSKTSTLSTYARCVRI